MMNFVVVISLVVCLSQTTSSASVITPTNYGQMKTTGTPDDLKADQSTLTPNPTDQLITSESVSIEPEPAIFYPDEDSSPTPAVPECLSPDDTFVNWLDDTCRTYVVCQDSVPALKTCPDGKTFGGLEGGCVTRTFLSCAVINEAMKEANEALSLVAHLGHRVKRSTDKIDASPRTENNIDIKIPLPESICEFISRDTNFLETNINNLIRVNVNCPTESVCKVPRLSFQCESSQDDDDDKDDDDHNDNDDEEEEEGEGKTNDHDDDDDSNDDDDDSNTIRLS